MSVIILIQRPIGHERVYLPLYKVADTPFHIQGDDMSLKGNNNHFSFNCEMSCCVQMCWYNITKKNKLHIDFI